MTEIQKNSLIHSTAIIHPSANLASTVSVGAYSIIGPEVHIEEGTFIDSHVSINKFTHIGKNNKIYSFASIGGDPQDSGYKEEKSWLEIGDNNVIREYVTINRGTSKENLLTRIGSNNMFMASSHIAHDCIVGDNIILANGATIGGHVSIGNYAFISAFCAIHQFCHIGAHSYIVHGAMITKDVLPYIIVSGNDPKVYGLNKIGLERRGFSKEAILSLSKAYKIIFRNSSTLEEAQKELDELLPTCSDIQLFIDGIKKANRGIIR